MRDYGIRGRLATLLVDAFEGRNVRDTRSHPDHPVPRELVCAHTSEIEKVEEPRLVSQRYEVL